MSTLSPDPTASELRPMNVAELAQLLGLAEMTIYNHAAKGKIPGVIRVGGRLMFSRPKIVAWLSGDEQPRAGKGKRG